MEIKKFLEINPVNPEYQRNPNKGKSLKKIADSMTKYGNLSMPVCVKQILKNGTERYVLVDGLHRVEAARLAKKLDTLDVIISPYVCRSNLEVVELMKTLNTTQSPWKLATYIHFYASCDEGNWKEYKEFEELRVKTHIGFSVLSVLLTGIRSQTVSIDIKAGNFSIRDKALSEKVIKAFKTFKTEWATSISMDPQRDLAYILYNYCEDHEDFVCSDFWNYLRKGPRNYRDLYSMLHTKNK